MVGGLLLSTLLGACVPDLDSLQGPAITSGAGGGLSNCDGGCGPTAGRGGGGSGSGSGGSGGSSGSSGSSGGTAGAPTPQLRHDFEAVAPAGLHGWSAVGDMRPPDVQDTVERSTEDAHDGSGSLRLIYDGEFSGPDAGPTDPWWGVIHSGVGLPTNAGISFWIMSTAPGASAEVFAQTGAGFTWNILGTAAMTAGIWQQISVLTPAAEAGAVSNWGIKIYAPLDIEGSIYIDDVSW